MKIVHLTARRMLLSNGFPGDKMALNRSVPFRHDIRGPIADDATRDYLSLYAA